MVSIVWRDVSDVILVGNLNLGLSYASANEMSRIANVSPDVFKFCSFRCGCLPAQCRCKRCRSSNICHHGESISHFVIQFIG